MKWLASLLILLCASWSTAGTYAPRRVIGQPTVSYLINEDFEGTGAASGWTANGTGVNHDYTTIALAGSQSFNVYYSTTARQANSATFTATGDVYVACKFRANALPNTTNSSLIAFNNSSGVEIAAVRTSNGGYLRSVVPGAIGTNSSDGLLTTTGMTYIKARYEKGTGSNAKLTVWYSSNGTSWTAGPAQITTGTSTNDATHIRFNAADTADYIFDDVRVSNADINY